MKQWVDLNCDLGEGCTNDEAIMPFISSANIACGYHAGDEKTIRETLLLAKKYNVAVGAHPSYPDRANFGRLDMNLGKEELKKIVIDQILLIKRLAEEKSLPLHHIKPHGALYNRSATDREVAMTITEAVQSIDDSLLLYGLANSESEKIAKELGITFYNEVFADRTYTDEGKLTPRTMPNALIESADASLQQVSLMLQKGEVISTTGKNVPIKVDTICIHGDGPHAVEFAKQIHQLISASHIKICSNP